MGRAATATAPRLVSLTIFQSLDFVALSMPSTASSSSSQLASQYTLLYRLEHSPPCEHHDSSIQSGTTTSISTDRMAIQPAPAQSSHVVRASGDDVFGERSTIPSLDFGETTDLAVLRSCPEGSTRFSETINKFVHRGLKRQPEGDEGGKAAVDYFFGLACAMESMPGFTDDFAAKVHDAMVMSWQRHISVVVGLTIRTPERLVAHLDDVITHAEVEGGTQPPLMMKLSLHNAIALGECAAPPTPHSQGERKCEPDSLFVESSDRQSSSRIAKAEEKDAGRADAALGQADAIVECASAAGPAAASKATSARFSHAKGFFVHHAVKAKKAAKGGIWVQDTEKGAARQEAKAEWEKMEMRTKSEWEDLFAQYRHGDESMLKSSATAHLFHDGEASCVWSNVNTASPVAEMPPSKRRKITATPPTPRDKVPQLSISTRNPR